MVRSKRKWKKDSPEKLSQRIDKELVQLRKKSQSTTQIQDKSPDTKKSKNSDTVSTDSSSDILSEPTLNMNPPLSPNVLTSGKNEEESIDKAENISDEIDSNKGDDKISAQNEKPPIENALSDITRALTELTQTVAAISVNMVSKKDISNLEEVMSKQGCQINENTEKLKTVMTRDEGKKIEKRVKDHDAIMETQSGNIEHIESKLVEVKDKIQEQDENVSKTAKRIDGLAESTTKNRENMHQEMDEIKQKLREQSAEIQFLKNGQKVATVHNPEARNEIPHDDPYTQHLYDPRLNVIIEGLKESDGEELIKEITALCGKMDVNLTPPK